MSSLLNERFIAVNPSLVKTVGLTKAVILQELHFASMEKYIGGPAGQVTMGQDELAERIGISRSSVHRALGDLEAEGLVSAEQDGAKAKKSYRVNVDEVRSLCANRHIKSDAGCAIRDKDMRDLTHPEPSIPIYEKEEVEEGKGREEVAPSPKVPDEPKPPGNEVVPVSDSSSDVAKPTAKHPDAQRLTETLFRCYALHADLEAPPKITRTSVRDMDLLLRRGPVELEPHEISPEHVEKVIHGIFDMLAERRDGFCWADQIRSPGNLRKHWTRIRGELNRRHRNTTQDRAAKSDRRAWIEVGLELNRMEAQR